jgi:plasmid stabilization system protein ParE
MKKYQFTPQALDDLFQIWSYIAGDNPEAADRVEEVIYLSCEFLSNSPMAGLVREDLTALPVRFWQVQPYRNYWLVYDPVSTPLRIIRILHRARNFPPLLS